MPWQTRRVAKVGEVGLVGHFLLLARWLIVGSLKEFLAQQAHLAHLPNPEG